MGQPTQNRKIRRNLFQVLLFPYSHSCIPHFNLKLNPSSEKFLISFTITMPAIAFLFFFNLVFQLLYFCYSYFMPLLQSLHLELMPLLQYLHLEFDAITATAAASSSTPLLQLQAELSTFAISIIELKVQFSISFYISLCFTASFVVIFSFSIFIHWFSYSGFCCFIWLWDLLVEFTWHVVLLQGFA